MGETEYDAFHYSYVLLDIFGILGNVLVIISILRQKNVLKNNYYFVVLHLAICDLGALIILLLYHIITKLDKEQLIHLSYSKIYCLGCYVPHFFQVAGIGIMLMISVLRYRATVHPLKAAIGRRKLKVICGSVYILGFIAGYVPTVPLCMLPSNDFHILYDKFHSCYILGCLLISPTMFMTVVYFKISRALMKQKKIIKGVCSNLSVRRSAPRSFILTYFRNRKTYFVCLLTVLCYGLATIPLTMRFILIIAEEFCLLVKYHWIAGDWSHFLQIAGWHSANPLIYGILDKKLIKFWKLCHKKK